MVKFKSQAAADLIMLNAHGNMALAAWHKAPGQAGILLVADMALAIDQLQQHAQQLDEQASHAAAAAASAQDDNTYHHIEIDIHTDSDIDIDIEIDTQNNANSPRSGGVRWAVRFAPLIAMVRTAMAAQANITWEASA